MPKTILIIEDDPDILELMTYILEEEGHQVFPSRICQSLEQIVAMRPDLILIDNRLSDCFGKDACLKIKEHEGTSGIPVILVSANNGLEEMALANHADDFLNKPFDVAVLVGLVKKWVTNISAKTKK